MNGDSKYMMYKDTDGETVYRFDTRMELEFALTQPEFRLFLFKVIEGENVEKLNIPPNESFIPDISIVLNELGLETHDFQEMEELFEETFENNDMYLPFDMDEIHYTSNDKYVGYCYRDSIDFNVDGSHYFFGVINIEKEGI